MAAPVIVIDLLNSLLEAEQESPFRFMTEGSIYLGRASVDLRKGLDYIASADHRRAGELWRTVEDLGAQPAHRRPLAADQLMAYLSIQFILPKLIEAKDLLLERYRNAAAAAESAGASPAVVELLRKHLSEHAAERLLLTEASS